MTSVRLGQIKSIVGYDRRATHDKPRWGDIPNWGRANESPFMNLTTDCLDRILSHPTLNIRDHLALAATCRSLRACYYSKPDKSNPNALLRSPLWAGLIALRPTPQLGKCHILPATPAQTQAVQKIATNGAKINRKKFKISKNDGKSSSSKGKKRAHDETVEDLVIRSVEWNEAVQLVHISRISKSEAKKHYKLTDAELDAYLCAFMKKNSYAPKTGKYGQMIREASLESLAYRLHGVEGHRYLLEKRAASAAKAKRTREANGTTQKRGPSGRFVFY